MSEAVVTLRVIIPARDEEAQLPKLLDSLSRHVEPADRLEVVVVDNGSRDRTPQLADAAGARVIHSQAQTIAAARNEGARGCSAPLLAFLDADVTVEDGWLQGVMAAFEEPQVVAAGSYPPAPETGSTWVQRAWSFLARRPSGRREVGWLSSANLVVRRDVFEELGGFDEGLISCEDADLSYRLRGLGKLIDDRAIAAVHHREPRTLMAFFRKELWHGRDSFARLGERAVDRSELPSLLIPVYLFGCALIGLVGLPLWYLGVGPWVTLAGLLAWTLPAVLYTLRSLVSKGGWRRWPVFLLLYLTYFEARTLALLLAVHRRTS